MVPSVDGRIVTSRWGLSGRVHAEYQRTAQTFEGEPWMIRRVSMEPCAGKAKVSKRKEQRPIAEETAAEESPDAAKGSG